MREHLFARVDLRLLCLAVFKRFEILAVLNLLLVAIRPKSRHNISEKHYYMDENEAYHRYLVLAQAAHTVRPEVDAVAHDDEALFFIVCCRDKIICIQVQTRKFFLHRFSPAAPLLEFNTGVYDLIEDINYNIRRNYKSGKNYCSSHYQRIVFLVYRRDEIAAETGNGEYLLHDERSGHKTRQHGADISNNGKDGVSQGVLEENLEVRQTLCPRGADIVLTHNIEQARAHEARYICSRINRQRRYRHYI